MKGYNFPANIQLAVNLQTSCLLPFFFQLLCICQLCPISWGFWEALKIELVHLDSHAVAREKKERKTKTTTSFLLILFLQKLQTTANTGTICCLSSVNWNSSLGFQGFPSVPKKDSIGKEVFSGVTRSKIQNRVKARQRQTYAPCRKLAGMPKYTEEATSKKQIPEDPLLYFSKEKQSTWKKKFQKFLWICPKVSQSLWLNNCKNVVQEWQSAVKKLKYQLPHKKQVLVTAPKPRWSRSMGCGGLGNLQM